MIKRVIGIFMVLLAGCSSTKKMQWPLQRSFPGGEAFYREASAMGWQQRDSFAVREILSGNIPGFLREFVPVQVVIADTAGAAMIHAVYYVAPDYLAIGNDHDWARIPLTPMSAQMIADSLDCFLPTRKMVNDIYRAAKVKLDPVPLYAFRDSTPTFWHHHLIIEGQRKERKGLIAGIKKDVVISPEIAHDPRPDRVAIYGWHRLSGIPIQPLYTGHVNWYVDYSHGIRLVYRKIKVGKRWMDYEDVLKDERLRELLCDEFPCDFYRYNY